jgi:hypothetical protein
MGQVEFNPVPVAYYPVQPISSEVEYFWHDANVPQPALLSRELILMADATTALIDNGNAYIAAAVQAFVHQEGTARKKAFSISTVTVFSRLGPAGDRLLFDENGFGDELSTACMIALSLIRSHLFMRFAFSRNWNNFILPAIAFKKFEQDKEAIRSKVPEYQPKPVPNGFGDVEIKPSDDLT